MPPPQRQISPPSLPQPPDVREREPLPTASCVAVVFKEHRYEDGAPKTWYFANIDQVERIHGRVQLRREGYGVVFDVPEEEVERVSTIDKERS